MSNKVVGVNDLSDYLDGVISKANHHAQKVNAIALTVIGAIIWAKDPDHITAMSRDGDVKNVIWVKINGCRYAFSYNHSTLNIDMRSGSIQGPTIASFSNTDTANDIFDFFAELLEPGALEEAMMK
jgi:hypothetical protein